MYDCLFLSVELWTFLDPFGRLSLPFFLRFFFVVVYIGPATLFARRTLEGEESRTDANIPPDDENRNSMEPWQSLASLCRCKFGYASSRESLSPATTDRCRRASKNIFASRGESRFHSPLARAFPLPISQSLEG